MAAGGFGIMEMLIVLLLGGGGGSLTLPVGLPPTPEDPKMAQVAPKDCLLYVTWAGTAVADPKSTNHTERLLAEPQVRALFKAIEEEIFAMIDRESRGHKEEATAMRTIATLIKQSLTHPAALYISRFDLGDHGPVIEAGIVVNFGDQAKAMEQMLLAFEGIIPEREGRVQVVDGMRRLPLPDDAPPVSYAFKGEYFVLAIGNETQTALPKALANGPAGGPDWLKAAREKVTVKRTSSFIYVNAATLVQRILPYFVFGMGDDDINDYQRVMAGLGLDKLTAVITSSGFEDDRFVTRTLLATRDNPGGVFKLFNKTGLTAADLADVPKDADIAFVARINAGDIFDEFFRVVGTIEPGANEDMRDELREMERELGFRVREDLLASLGDVWSIYNSPGEGGLIFTGLTAVVQVKDRAKVKKAIDQFASIMEKEMNPRREEGNNARPWRQRRYEFKSIDFMGQQIQYINPIGDDWVVTPAWCLTEDRFVIAPYPQMIKAYLARKADKKSGSVADQAELKAAMTRPGGGGAGADGPVGPAMVSYIDTPEMFKKVYPLAHPLMTLLCSQLQRETGMKLDASLLPMASAVLPHLRPDVSTVTRTSQGVLIESRQSIPMIGATTSLPVLMMGMWAAPMGVHRHDAAPAIQPRFEEPRGIPGVDPFKGGDCEPAAAQEAAPRRLRLFRKGG